MTRAFQTKRTPFSRRILMASTALVAAGAMVTTPINAKADNAWVLDQQGGSFDTDTSINNVTNITQHTDRAYGVGNLDIHEYQTVNIQQNSSGSLFIARDDRNDPTQILGALNANGQVMIIDRNGVFFGENSRIDVNSIVATTADVNVDAIMGGANIIEFTNLGDATIENRGSITVAEAGIAAFVSPTVKNSGVINAKLGKVAFAAGEKVTLDLYGDQLVEIEAGAELEDALLENSGTINAQGGVVQITARAAKDAVDNVINMSGVINASSVSQKGGKIILGGGDSGVVEVSGTLDASGATGGGEIDIVGENTVITETASVSVDATDNGNGGETFIWGNNAAILSGSVSARGGANGGNGGKVELSAGNAVGFNGNVDTSAANGETGTFLIDPENINLGDFTGLQTLGDLAADVFAGGSLGELRIDDQALANTLKNTDVNLWASNSIYTSSDFDISTWVELCGPVCQFFGGSTTYGITANDLGLSAPVITFDHNVTLGTGNLILQDTTAGDSFLGFGLIDAPADIEHTTLNLNAQVLTRDTVGGATSVAGDAQVGSVADTINVLSDSALIQQAISFADNPDGALITVAAGTYNESVNVNKHNLTLEGANVGVHGAGERGAESIINPNSPGFLVTGNGVTIDGFEIEGGDVGIKVAGADDVTLTNNRIHGQRHPAAQGMNVGLQGTGDGILVNGYADNTNISDNYIYDTDDEGVQVFQATNLTVHNNFIDNSGDGFDSNGDIGVALDSVTGSSFITANYIRSGFDAGIEVKDSSGVTIGGSEADGNIVDGYGMGADDKDVGIYVKRSSGIVVSYNEVDGAGADGIYNNNTDGTDISYNTVTNVGGVGIAVNPSDNVEVTFNEIDNTGSHGVEILGGEGNIVSNNEIGLGIDSTIGGDGIHVDGSNGFTAKSNTITNTISPAFDIGSGIQVLNSVGVTIGGEGELDGNTIYNTAWDGVRLEDVSEADVIGNDIDDVQRTGIYGRQVSELLVSGNDIDNAQDFRGIDVFHGTDIFVVSNYVDTTNLDGIFARNIDGLFVVNNYIGTDGGAIGQDGIHAFESDGARITGNLVNDTVANGIYNGNSDSSKLILNTITNAGANGILVNPSSNVLVDYNTIDDVAEDGVHIQGGEENTVSNNFIGTNGDADNIGDDGVELEGSYDSDVTGNTITETVAHGVHLRPHDEGEDGSYSDDAYVANNYISNAGGDGVHAYDSYDLHVFNNSIYNVEGNGVYVEEGSETIVEANTIFNVGQNGIYILNEQSEGDDEEVEGFDIRDNIIGNAAFDGIKVRDFYAGWIANNQIGFGSGEGLFPTGVGDDGIDVKNGDYISIYGNNIFGAGFYLDGANVSWSGADGIRVKNVGGLEFLPPIAEALEEDGFGYGFAGADVEIFGNTIAFTQDDGIEVDDANRVHIEGNILGHIGFDAWDADGIRVTDSAHTVIKSNGVADVLDDGIRVDGGNYAGIFDNHVLRVGKDGIQVSNVFFEETMDVSAAFADIDYPTVGYPVSIEGNEVVLTGRHGIHVRDGGATRIIDNQVSFAGIGQDNVYGAVNDVAGDIHDMLNGSLVFEPMLAQLLIEDSEPEYSTLYWGNGDGIKVENVFRDEFYPYPTDTISTFAGVDSGDSHSFYYGYDGWDVLIQGNNVAYTGGDGIDVNNAGTTLIGGYEGDENTVYQAGIASTLISGASSFADWTESGPFLDTEARRVVWIDGEWDAEWTSGDYGDLTGALYPYLTESTMSIQHDTHDGIRATNIYNNYYFRPRILEADTIQISESAGNAGLDGGLYGYAVNVIGNDVNTTGDDGIEVGWASSALIKDNTVMGAGIGGYDGSDLVAETKVNYGVGDYNGADGISAHNIYGEGEGIRAAGSVSTGDYEEYALVIDGNYVNGTADDGIEAVYAGRTLISNNQTYNNGVYGNGYNDVYDDIDQYDYDGYYPGYYGTAGDGYGSDGIHARYIQDHTSSHEGSSSYDEETGYTTYVDTYTYGDDVAVVINNNIVDTTGDDGIEVLSSGRTVIDNNNITHSGYGGGYYYGAADGWGADGIHVRDVITDGFQETYTEVRDGYYGYYGYYVSSDYEYENLFNNGTSVLITNNYVDVTGDDGIQVLFSGNSVIDSNEVYNAGYGDSIPYEGEGIYDGNGADGIHVKTGFIESYYGYYGGGDAKLALAEISVADTSDYFLSTSTVITNNIVNTADDDGIDVEGVTDVFIGFNDVDNVNDDGIEVVGYAGGFFDSFEEEIAFGVADVEPTFTVDILANNVNTSGDTGITVEGMDFITVSNNDVLNSDEIGVLIAGPNNGSVILSGNTLTNNDVHARFESGVVDLTGSGNDFNNGRVGIQFDGPLVSLIDDEPTDQFEGTLGSQTFTNQSQFFVELSNDALFEPGQPSIYNALDSSYFFNGDYFSPSDTGGIVTLAQLNFLEDMFYHFNDDNTLGLFFFGALTLENLEDFFNTFGTFDGNVSGASVTITGLPTTSSQQTALLLNNLTPAAGGEEGGIPGDTNGDGELSAEEAAALDPAAGGEEVNCWNDASSGLENGATVNYSFDTSFESALADTAGCNVSSAQ